MKLKYPMKGDEMQSLYTLAWFGKRTGANGAEDPLFSGYHAAEPEVVAEQDATAEEAEVLAAAMAVRTQREPSAEEMEWILHRKRLEAERTLHLFNLGFTEL